MPPQLVRAIHAYTIRLIILKSAHTTSNGIVVPLPGSSSLLASGQNIDYGVLSSSGNIIKLGSQLMQLESVVRCGYLNLCGVQMIMEHVSISDKVILSLKELIAVKGACTCSDFAHTGPRTSHTQLDAVCVLIF